MADSFISTGINKFGYEYVVCKREEGREGKVRRGEKGRREEGRGGERRGERRRWEVRAPVPSFLLESISLVMNMWYVREEGREGKVRRGEKGRREEGRGGERRGERRRWEVRAPVPSFLLESISLVMNMWYVREEGREGKVRRGEKGRREEGRGGERRGERRRWEVRAPMPSFLLVSISLVMNMWYVREGREGKVRRGEEEER